MRNIVIGSVLVLATLGSATCAAKTAQINPAGMKGQRAGTHPLRAKILLKRDPANPLKCLARTMPNNLEVDPNEDDGVIWTVKQLPGSKCLPSGVDLEVRWNTQNPTACMKLGTHTSGSKTMFECDLDTFLPGSTYKYTLYRVGGGLDEKVEDPDIEIVVF